jgi:hypothetical protein
MRRFGHPTTFRETDRFYVTFGTARIRADEQGMTSVPILGVGTSVLVAATPSDAPWRMVVDLAQEGHITLATPDDEPLPREWQGLAEVHVTSLDRFSVHLIHVPVVRVGTTRLVVREPDASMPLQRRAYARVFTPVPAAFMLLDENENRWLTLDADVRDLGGGGCSIVTDSAVPEGTRLAASLQLDNEGPIVVVGRVLPREELPTIGRVLTRVEFLLIREAERDRILRYVLMALAGLRHRAPPTH